MSRLRSKLTYANIVSTLCLFLVLGGGAAFAATQLPKNSVGSKQLKKEAVTPSKLSGSAKTSLHGATGATGAQGPQGPQGAPGTPGQNAVSLWAVVEENGVLARGSGVTKADQINTGTYEVIFNQNVENCAFGSSLGDGETSEAEWIGNVATTRRGGQPDGIWVRTFNSAGTGANLPFVLQVSC